jgi:hypothetical protein
VLQRWVARWSATDARSTWLCAMVLAASRPSRLTDVRLAAEARAVAATLGTAAAARQGEEGPPSGDAAFAPNAGIPDAVPSSRAPVARDGLLPMARGAATPNAGLSFVIPILARLGMATFLASRPYLGDDDFARRVLGHLGTRLSIHDDDPVLRALDAPRADASVLVDALAVAWSAAVRRWCRRYVKMPLAALVRRPGHITATRTHLDVAFALRQADVRIRKVGLDLDPGWVPWLGRVVRFHYRDD